MKRIASLLLPVALMVNGCATTGEARFDETKRKKTTSIEVYKISDKPQRPYKEIAEFTFLGLIEEEANALREFIAKAKKLGANAILLLPPEDAGERYRIGHQSPIPHRIFKASAIAYGQ